MDEKTVKYLLGKRIRQIRKKLKWTQFKLGEKIDIDQRQIAQIECGKSFPSLKTFVKLCNVFGCKIQDLFDYSSFEATDDLKKEIKKKLHTISDKDIKLYLHLLKIIENYKVT